MTEFQIIDFICNAFFTVELLTRFLTCPSKRVFVRRLPIIIDLIALVSFYADLTIFILGVSVSVMFLISLILSLLPCRHPHTTQIGEMQAMSTGFCVKSNEPGCKHWQICVYSLFYKVSCSQEGEGGRGERHHGRGPHQDLQDSADLKIDPTPHGIPAPGKIK